MKIFACGSSLVDFGKLEKFKKLGEVELLDACGYDYLLENASDAEALIINSRVEIDDSFFEKMKDLKYLGLLATGFNNVDIEAARKHEVTVCNVPAYSTESVAQTVFAHILELTHHVGFHSNQTKSGNWMHVTDEFYSNHPLIELDRKVMGIIGFGNIGHAVARIARAFGMEVIACSRSKKDVAGVEFTEMDEVFKRSDFISLHTALNDETYGLVNFEKLSLMKKSAFLINTSRGDVIVEKDLARALQNGTIAGAGLDVMSQEPPKSDNPLLNIGNCFITPHIAYASQEAVERLVDVAVDNLRSFIDGNANNVVS